MRDFNIFWASETLADIFDRFVVLGVPLLAIALLNASPLELGVISSMSTLPLLLVTPFAGVLVDRSRIGRLIFNSNLVRAFFLATICVVAAIHMLNFFTLAILVLLVGAAAAIGNVATLAYTPVITPRLQLASANTRISITTAVADTLGLAAGGSLIALLGAANSIGLSALAFTLAALILLLIRTREPTRIVERLRPVQVIGSIWTGMKRTVADRHVGPMALASAWFNAFEQVLIVNLLLVATGSLAYNGTAIGFLMASTGLGGLLGGFAARPVGRRSVGARLLIGKAFSSLGPVIVAIGLATEQFTFPLLAIGLGLFGFGTTIYNVHSVTLRQLLIAPRVLGRVSASYRFIAHGSIPLGALLAGGLGTLVGPLTAVVYSAVAIALGSAVFAITPPARLKQDPEQPVLAWV